MTSPRVPVTILTGFLGAGKTTLLNRILKEEHGRRIAVIENEFGDIGIDDALVIGTDEEIFETTNGCICCTVRGDLIRVLTNLEKRRAKFDRVLIETTGLADPGPVAQTFFMDEDIQEAYSLDAIVTLVDAHHLEQQLGRSKETEEQIGFADVLLLNKADLLGPDALDRLESRLRQMNPMAKIHRSVHADVPVDAVLGLGAFDLEGMLDRRPDFLEPEYPFEWTGVYELRGGSHELRCAAGPDPLVSLVRFDDIGADDDSLRRGAERALRRFAEPAEAGLPGSEIVADRHVRIPATGTYRVETAAPTRVAIYAEHYAHELGLTLTGPDGQPVPPVRERTWRAEHEHDDDVGAVCIEREGEVDPERMNAWMSGLLAEKGLDLFRMKGFFSVAGRDERFVLQGVHMLLDSRPDQPWGDRPRKNQLVFIGRQLDEQAIREGFEACLT